MFFHGISGTSNTSGAEAVSNAIGMAVADYSEGAATIHIIVTNVFEIDGKWQAMVRVVVQPNLDHRLEEKADPEESLEQKKEDEHNLEQKRAAEDAKKRDMYFDLLEDFEEMLNEHGVFVLLPANYEDVYYDIVQKYPALNIRSIEEGPLWDSVEKILLDNEFYEATHYNKLRARYSGGGGHHKALDLEKTDTEQSLKQTLIFGEKDFLAQLRLVA